MNSPLARFSRARPAVLRAVVIASSQMSCLSSISAASVSVPGVTMRATARSTGPLLVAGSPICSQITADSPALTSLAR